MKIRMKLNEDWHDDLQHTIRDYLMTNQLGRGYGYGEGDWPHSNYHNTGEGGGSAAGYGSKSGIAIVSGGATFQ